MTKTVKCHVCDKDVPEDMLSLEYEGVRHAFCCPYYRARFVEDCELEFIHSTAGAGGPDSENSGRGRVDR